jgi:hypothetical protein
MSNPMAAVRAFSRGEIVSDRLFPVAGTSRNGKRITVLTPDKGLVHTSSQLHEAMNVMADSDVGLYQMASGLYGLVEERQAMQEPAE